MVSDSEGAGNVARGLDWGFHSLLEAPRSPALLTVGSAAAHAALETSAWGAGGTPQIHEAATPGEDSRRASETGFPEAPGEGAPSEGRGVKGVSGGREPRARWSMRFVTLPLLSRETLVDGRHSPPAFPQGPFQ